MRSISATALLVLAGCAARPATPASAPPASPPAAAVPATSCLVLIGAPPRAAYLCDAGARRELQGAVAKAFVEAGRFRILAPDVVTPIEPALHEARGVARRVGAQRLALLRLHHLDLRTRTHHVRRYHDGSAAGELLLVEVESGAIESAARQTVHLSTRARYATPALARDLLLTRLAQRLAGEVLGAAPR